MKYILAISVVCLTLGYVQAQAAVSCPSPNGRFPDPKRCDQFVECRKGVGELVTCGDGLLVNEDEAPFRYPCDYATTVDCGTRSIPPATTPGASSCPRKWGMFPKVGGNCGQFVNCVDGTDYNFTCPEGLAWHPTLLRCEWPDQVPTCNVEEFLGFKCPATSDPSSGADAVYPNPKDCARFFVCVGGTSPRLHICEAQTVFNPVIGVCDDPKNVTQCSNYYEQKPKSP